MALSIKQKLFVAHYCETWNATKAAVAAGYPEKSARSQGSRLLTNVDIAAAIQEHIASIMPAGEVLQRLADHARGSMADFIDVDTNTLDLQKAAQEGKLHLVKKFTRADTETSSRVSIEIHDAQSALGLLGKHHGLFRDVIDLNFNPDDFTLDQLRRIAAGESPDKVRSGG